MFQRQKKSFFFRGRSHNRTPSPAPAANPQDTTNPPSPSPSHSPQFNEVKADFLPTTLKSDFGGSKKRGAGLLGHSDPAPSPTHSPHSSLSQASSYGGLSGSPSSRPLSVEFTAERRTMSLPAPGPTLPPLIIDGDAHTGAEPTFVFTDMSTNLEYEGGLKKLPSQTSQTSIHSHSSAASSPAVSPHSPSSAENSPLVPRQAMPQHHVHGPPPLLQSTASRTSLAPIPREPKHRKSSSDQVRRHACTWPNCSMRFNTTSELKSHKRVHTGERPYVCSVAGCGKRFAQSGGLVRHKRTHTGDKPYKCGVVGCNRAFTESGHLVRHTATHSGAKPLPCTFGCGQQFTTQHQLMKHQRVHTGAKAYLCPIQNCNRPFSQAGALHRHIQRVHPGQPVPHIPFMGNNPDVVGVEAKVSGAGSDEEMGG